MSEQKSLGKFTFVLHSHLPYVVSNGTWPHGMVWINEAACETYIPLLNVFNSQSNSGEKLAITIGISPVLAEQLSNDLFIAGLIDYQDQKIEAAKADRENFLKAGETSLAELAEYWIEFYQTSKTDFVEKYNKDIIKGFRDLQDAGKIEIITCGATHGYLPLLATDEAVNAQVELAVSSYQNHFGRKPKGIWLPECAYRPGYHWVNPVGEKKEGFDRLGVEEVLQKHGLRFFIVDNHLLKGGKAIGTYLARFEGLSELWKQSQSKFHEVEFDEKQEREPYRVYWMDGTTGDKDPVGILTRDSETSLQVWSGEYGYPGDGNYLDFHKKHFPGGHKYWRVTHAKADLGDKLEYDTGKLEGRIQENADHFVSLIYDVLNSAKTEPEKRILTCPFDTELFGHWWFEGPRWLEKVLSQINTNEHIQASQGSEMIESTGKAPVITLPEGSWGEGGFHYIWLNEKVEWVWKLIHKAEKEMTKFARLYSDSDGKLKEMLQQLGRELLLLESSDWPFLISTIAAADYAEMRINRHADDFAFIKGLIEKLADNRVITGSESEKYDKICERDALFNNLDISIWK
jgi:1,4-alpha-glucan branching enzyme